MKAATKTARIVGILYIIGTVAGILSIVFRGPVGDVEDYLVTVSTNETGQMLGAFFVVTMGVSLATIPVVMFPILKRHNEVLALGYVVFRGGLETIGYLAIAATWLLMVPLSQVYVQAGASDASSILALGNLFLESDEVIGGAIMTIVFSLGSLIFNYLLYRTRLVPRWLSGWGLLAGTLYLASGLLAMFDIVDPLTTIYIVLNLPKAFQEMVLAAWLIIRGFDPSATVFGNARTA